MKVSIIIPCFNEEMYLPVCLNSLLQQSRLPDEIVICDNNSTDHSLAVAKSFQTKLPIVILKQPIKGIVPTVEHAWHHASGDLILRTDADAVFPKDWIKNIIKHFTQDPTLAACGGDWYSSDGNLLARALTRIAFPLNDIIYPLYHGYRFLYGPNIAIKRSVLDKLNGFATTDPYITDDQLISQKLAQNKMKYARFRDCYNYHSTRRFNQNLLNAWMFVRCTFNAKYYREKSI